MEINAKNITHNKYYADFKDFSAAISKFLYYDINKLTDVLPQRLKDNFHILKPVFLQAGRCIYIPILCMIILKC
jgi:hypothetical protein